MNKRDMKRMITPILFLVIGGLVGAGMALLMAPQSGEEIRSNIRNRSLAMKDRALNTVEDTRNRAEKTINEISSQAKDRVSNIKDRGQKVMEDEKEQLRSQMKH